MRTRSYLYPAFLSCSAALLACSIVGRGAPNLVETEPAITTSLADVGADVALLDDFRPAASQSLMQLGRGPNGEFILDRYGLLDYSAQSYCLHAGRYAPGGGDGYAFAQLQGPLAPIVRNVLRRSFYRSEVSQQHIQMLLWAIISRTKVSEMPSQLQATAQALLTPEEITTLNEGSLGVLEQAAIEAAIEAVPAYLRQVVEANAQVRRLLTAADVAFETLERVAVPTGDPPHPEDSRRIPEGRWSYHRDRYFVRFLPFGYSTTTVQLYVPGHTVIERDARGRIASLADDGGARLKLEYDDEVAPLLSGGTHSMRGFTLKRVAFTCPLTTPAQRSWVTEWKGIGWTLVGGHGESGSWSTFQPADDFAPDRFQGWEQRLEAAHAAESRVQNFAEWLDERGQSATHENLALLFDLTHLSHALAEVVQGDHADSSLNDLRTCRGLQQRARIELVGCLIDGSCGASGTDGASQSAPRFDPSEHVAVPGNTGRQRLGQSPRDEEEESDPCLCGIWMTPAPEHEYIACDGSYRGSVFASAPGGGENYQWAVTAGTHRVQIIGPSNQRSVELGFIVPSESPDDVRVAVSFTKGDNSCSCGRSFSVPKPGGLDVLEEVSQPATATDGTWVMGVERLYQVVNQFGFPLRRYDMDVTERLTGVDLFGSTVSWTSGTRYLSYNPGSIAMLGDGAPRAELTAQSGWTDADGRFPDTHMLETVDAAPFPAETDFIVTQEFQVEGCSVRMNTVHFLAESVEIGP